MDLLHLDIPDHQVYVQNVQAQQGHVDTGSCVFPAR